MPKTENKMTKTDILQVRVTPSTKMKLDIKRRNKTQTDALNEALALYLSDNSNLLQQIHQGFNFRITNKNDYQELRTLYLSSRSLYADFSKFETNHQEVKANVLKNVFRDFLLPTLEQIIAEYEETHKVNDPITV